jgi:hypothetical protein
MHVIRIDGNYYVGPDSCRDSREHRPKDYRRAHWFKTQEEAKTCAEKLGLKKSRIEILDLKTV